MIAIAAFNLFGNILIKNGAVSKGNIFFNYYTVLGYVFFLVVIVLNFQLIALVPLAHISLLISLNYLNTFLAGIIIFREKLTLNGVFGIVIICLGLICFQHS